MDRLAGVVDLKIIYAKESTPKFLFSRSRDFHGMKKSKIKLWFCSAYLEVEIDCKREKIVHVSAGRKHLAILTTHGNGAC